MNVSNWDAKLINSQEHAAFFKECFKNRAFKLKRIFRASEHDFSIYKFHELCDNKGPTLFVGKSEQHEKTFGGFTSVDLNKYKGSIWETDHTAFLF